MITKERLLAGLRELIYVEEGMVTMFANFDQALVNQTEGLDEERKKVIKKILSALHRDSTRHKKKLDELIAQIEVIDKNEY